MDADLRPHGPASSPRTCVLPTGLRPAALGAGAAAVVSTPLSRQDEGGGRPAAPSWGQRSWAGPFRLRGPDRDPDPIKCGAEALAKDSAGTHLSLLFPGLLPWEASSHPTIIGLLEWRCSVGRHVLSTPGSEPPGASSSLVRPAIRAPWDLPIHSRGLLLPSLQPGPLGGAALLRTPGAALPASLGSQVSPQALTVRVRKGVQRRSEPPRGSAPEDASPRHEGCYFCEVHLQNTSVNFLYLFIHSKNLN